MTPVIPTTLLLQYVARCLSENKAFRDCNRSRLATADIAVDSLVEAVARPDCSGLAIRCDNYRQPRPASAAYHQGGPDLP